MPGNAVPATCYLLLGSGMTATLYLERLTDRDLDLLARAAGERGERLRRDPGRIDGLLGRPEVFRALFGPGTAEPFLVGSPFLVFSVLLARTAGELAAAGFVREWIAPGRQVAVFDAERLREFAAEPSRRMFLAELLASYTHVTSGSVWVRTRRGWARRRFSELDPVRLAELAEVVPEDERLAVYRRLGDLALFLSGVFPDYVGDRLFRPVQVERLQRLVVEGGEEPLAGGALGLLERLGRQSYRRVVRAVREPGAALARTLAEVAEGFALARRVLNFLTERFLFARREDWFAAG